MEKKRAAFAGSWYPASAAECRSAINGFISEKTGPETGAFMAGIVPHAGWFYSGSIACRVIASLAGGKEKDGAEKEPRVDTVVLFGGHMHKQSEPFIMTRGLIETPLGDLTVDAEFADRLADGISIRKRSPERFPDENTLELQYPFVRHFFPDSNIVVCGVAPSNFAAIIGGMAVETAAALGRTIRVIGSTDMTHYGTDFGFTPAGTGEAAVEWVRTENDAAAVDAMTRMDEGTIISQGLANHNMCCPGAVAATVAAAKKMGADRAVRLDYATSYEKTQGASFVGYAGVLYAKDGDQ